MVRQGTVIGGADLFDGISKLVGAGVSPESGLTSMLIERVKLWQNGTNESFNGKFRD